MIFLKKNKCLRLDLQTSLANPRSAYVMNPAAHMTWADEDFIGRISRISRRTHVLTAPARSIDRALGHYRRRSEMFGPSYLDHLDLVPEDPAWKWAAVGIAVGVVCCRHLNSSACWWFGHLYERRLLFAYMESSIRKYPGLSKTLYLACKTR